MCSFESSTPVFSILDSAICVVNILAHVNANTPIVSVCSLVCVGKLQLEFHRDPSRGSRNIHRGFEPCFSISLVSRPSTSTSDISASTGPISPRFREDVFSDVLYWSCVSHPAVPPRSLVITRGLVASRVHRVSCQKKSFWKYLNWWSPT